MIDILKLRTGAFIFSGILFVLSLVALIVYPLRPNIEFTGGSLLEIQFTGERPETAAVSEVVSSALAVNPIVQYAGEKNMIVKTPFLSEEDHQKALDAIRDAFQTGGAAASGSADSPITVEAVGGNGGISFQGAEISTGDDQKEAATVDRVIEERFETIGPSISDQLKKRSWQTILIVIIAIVAYVAYAFRKVSKPVQSWKYGVVAIVALVHDIVITMGVFTLVAHFVGEEIGVPFVVALLTILGYSVNDTIVVFDRIREQLIRHRGTAFHTLVKEGVQTTVSRSINTSLTTLLVLVALFFFGAASVKYFALTLIIGITIGTYSSIFIASPLLLLFAKWNRS